jgi:hypothetical protein
LTIGTLNGVAVRVPGCSAEVCTAGRSTGWPAWLAVGLAGGFVNGPPFNGSEHLTIWGVDGVRDRGAAVVSDSGTECCAVCRSRRCSAWVTAGAPGGATARGGDGPTASGSGLLAVGSVDGVSYQVLGRIVPQAAIQSVSQHFLQIVAQVEQQ